LGQRGLALAFEGEGLGRGLLELAFLFKGLFGLFGGWFGLAFGLLFELLLLKLLDFLQNQIFHV
jgi:hypothetical protein